MSLIQNPILRGFNADPSIITRRGYVLYCQLDRLQSGSRACVYAESKDLKNWNLPLSPLSTHRPAGYGRATLLLGGILERRRSLEPTGNSPIWCIPMQKVAEGAFKGMTNYLTTAKDIPGPVERPDQAERQRPGLTPLAVP